MMSDNDCITYIFRITKKTMIVVDCWVLNFWSVGICKRSHIIRNNKKAWQVKEEKGCYGKCHLFLHRRLRFGSSKWSKQTYVIQTYTFFWLCRLHVSNFASAMSNDMLVFPSRCGSRFLVSLFSVSLTRFLLFLFYSFALWAKLLSVACRNKITLSSPFVSYSYTPPCSFLSSTPPAFAN